jgi:hypothetical protein
MENNKTKTKGKCHQTTDKLQHYDGTSSKVIILRQQVNVQHGSNTSNQPAVTGGQTLNLDILHQNDTN